MLLAFARNSNNCAHCAQTTQELREAEGRRTPAALRVDLDSVFFSVASPLFLGGGEKGNSDWKWNSELETQNESESELDWGAKTNKSR